MTEAVKLTDPFPAKAVGKLPRITCKQCSEERKTRTECPKHGQKKTKCRICKNFITPEHIHLDFVGHGHVTERLLQVDPSWSWEPMATDANGMPLLDQNGGLWIRLTVNGVTRPGYGDATNMSGSSAVKEAIGDALRNAAMRFGVALDLWMKETATAPAAEQTEREPEQEPTAADVRRMVLAEHRRLGGGVSEAETAFVEWSQGTSIGQAEPGQLLRYLKVVKEKRR